MCPAATRKMFLSVLIAVTLQLAQCRRLTDIDNDVAVNVEGNLGIRQPRAWVKISQVPVAITRKDVGAHVELSCEAMGSPPPTIQWYKYNLRITENESFETNVVTNPTGLAIVSSRLVINYLLPRHQDIYRCVAGVGGENMASASAKLIVLNKEGREMNFTQLIASKILGAHHLPRVTFYATTIMDVIGTDVILPCKSVGNPKPNLMWLDQNSNRLVDDDRFTILSDGELRIKSINWGDMGVYTCVIQNMLGQDSIESFLYPMAPSK